MLNIKCSVPMETEGITFEPSRLCRACGAERMHRFPLSARNPDVGLRLDDMLMACTDLKIHVGDGLPSWICYSCAEELKTSYRFKQQCETTDRYFNELGLKSNEIKQEGENENLLELKEEKDTNDNSNRLSFEEVSEGISKVVVISRETKQEQGDLLTITETIVYKQEEHFSEVTEDEAIRVGNLEDSPLNEDLCFENFPNEKENQNIVSKKAENEEFSSDYSHYDYFPKEELGKTNRLEYFESNIRGKYPSSSNLQLRKQTRENGGRTRFKCDICETSYSTNRYLGEHKKTHENNEEKYYKCNVCEESFSTSGNLREHKKIHENGKRERRRENGERKRFECDVCGKSYWWSRNLQEHKRRHENGGAKRFKCDVCEKPLATSRSLRDHKRRHTKGRRKRFKCDGCEKSFAASWYLRVHRKTHENDILYEWG